jgi:hypothetical protein
MRYGITLGRDGNKSVGGKSKMNAELETAQAELARVKAEAAAAQQAAQRLLASLKKSGRDAKVRLRVTAVVILTAALIKIAWQSAAVPVTPVSRAAPLPAMPAADTSGSRQDLEFNRALNRLRDAFHSFPDEDQLDLIREINDKRPMACPLLWNDAGVPSLFVGDEKGEAPPSILVALNHCASSIEKLRAERGPAQ